MKAGDRVIFHPYTKPSSFGPGGYRATVERVHKSGEVSVWVTLPDGREPVLLSEVPVGEFGTSEPGTVTPMAQAVVTRRRERQTRLSLVKPKAIAEPAALEVVMPEPPCWDAIKRGPHGRKKAKPEPEALDEQPELVTVVPKKPKQAEPDLQPHWNGELHACPMCMRKHRGDGPYCSERCETRAAKPPDLVLGVRRSLYFNTNSPKGPMTRPGEPQSRRRNA